MRCDGGPTASFELLETGELELPYGGRKKEGPETMPEMIVNPMWHEESGQVVVYLGVANPSDEELVIRKGQVYAMLSELRGLEWHSGADKQQFEAEARVAALSS